MIATRARTKPRAATTSSGRSCPSVCGVSGDVAPLAHQARRYFVRWSLKIRRISCCSSGPAEPASEASNTRTPALAASSAAVPNMVTAGPQKPASSSVCAALQSVRALAVARRAPARLSSRLGSCRPAITLCSWCWRPRGHWLADRDLRMGPSRPVANRVGLTEDVASVLAEARDSLASGSDELLHDLRWRRRSLERPADGLTGLRR